MTLCSCILLCLRVGQFGVVGIPYNRTNGIYQEISGGLVLSQSLVRVLIVGEDVYRNSYINEFESISVVAHRIHLRIQMIQISPTPPRQSRKAPSIEWIGITPLRQMVVVRPPPLVRASYPVVPVLQIYSGRKVGELRPPFSTREPDFSLWLL